MTGSNLVGDCTGKIDLSPVFSLELLHSKPFRATGVTPLRDERGQVSMKYEAPIADLPELLSTDEGVPNATSQDRSAGNQRVRMQPVQRLLHNRRPLIDSGCPRAIIAG